MSEEKQSTGPNGAAPATNGQGAPSSGQFPYMLLSSPPTKPPGHMEPVSSMPSQQIAFSQSHLLGYPTLEKHTGTAGLESSYDDSQSESTDGGRSAYSTFDSTGSPYSTYSETESSIQSTNDLLRRISPRRSQSSPSAGQKFYDKQALANKNPDRHLHSGLLPGSQRKTASARLGLTSDDSGLEQDASEQHNGQSSDGEMVSLPTAVRRPPLDLTSIEQKSSDGGIRGGYLAEFDPELDDKHRCRICQLALREPVQTECGHRFCRSCLLPVLKSKFPKCPEDKTPIKQADVYPDNFCKKEVLRLNVKCSNYVAGCPWHGSLQNLNMHEATCHFTLVPCHFQSRGCEELLRRADISRHTDMCLYRDVTCTECGETLAAKLVKGHLEKDCPAVEQECPKGCGLRMKRIMLQQHYDDDCPKADKECEFSDFGCEEKVVRDEMSDHQQKAVVSHVSKTRSFLIDQTRQVSGVKEGVGELRSSFAEIQRQYHAEHEARLAAETRVGQLEERLFQAESAINSLTSQIQAVVETRSAAAVAAPSKDVEKLSERVEVLESRAVSTDMIRTTTEKNMDMMKTRLTAIEKQSALMNQVLNRSDAILAEFDLRLLTQEAASYNGILIWKIPDYKRHFDDAVSGRKPSLYSPPFFTSRHGYKMCARVYLNGESVGKNSHMSVFFVIMRGQFDGLLPWPFQQKVTMTLIDQSMSKQNISDTFFPDASSSSYHRPTTEMNIASGCPRFVSIDSMRKTPGFIRENTIYLRIAVETKGLQNY